MILNSEVQVWWSATLSVIFGGPQNYSQQCSEASDPVDRDSMYCKDKRKLSSS